MTDTDDGSRLLGWTMIAGAAALFPARPRMALWLVTRDVPTEELQRSAVALRRLVWRRQTAWVLAGWAAAFAGSVVASELKRRRTTGEDQLATRMATGLKAEKVSATSSTTTGTP